MGEEAKRDQNHVTSMLFVGSDGATYNVKGDKDTGRLYVDVAGGSGTVTSLSAGTGILLTPDPITTTGSIALVARIAPIATLGTAGQLIRVNAGATALEYFTAAASGDVVGPASATDNAVARFDGTTGKLIQNSAVTIADTSGDITAGKYNGLTVTASTGVLTIANGKTLTVSNTLTFTGTDSSSVAFGAGGTVLYTASTIPLTVGSTTIASGTTTRILYDNAGVLGEYTLTGTGTVVVMATSPTFTTGATTPQLLATANDSGALGASGTAFADLFLASGGVINWAAANATITHSSGLLTTNVPVTVTGVTTADGFAPTSTTATGNRLYLPAANTLGWAINGSAEMQLTATALSPAVDGGNSLGTTALGWQNLFGNTGFVINFENSDWVATHTAGILTVGTGDLRVTTAGTNTASVVTVGGTQTLTNKRVTPRVLSATSYTTDTGSSINGDTQDMFIVTAQTGALKFNNPSGTPTDGQKFIITVASSTTSARALTWDTAYGSTTVTLPTTTAATTATLSIGFIWSASKSLWQCVAVA